MLKLKLQYFGHLMRKVNSLEKIPDAEKDWKQKEMTEDEMVGWHHRLDGHEFEQAPGDGEGHESLACCSPWGQELWHHLETEQLLLKCIQPEVLAIWGNSLVVQWLGFTTFAAAMRLGSMGIPGNTMQQAPSPSQKKEEKKSLNSFCKLCSRTIKMSERVPLRPSKGTCYMFFTLWCCSLSPNKALP